MSLTLHQHPFAAYCWKALIALYEREVPFERVLVDGDEARARHAALWPLQGMPVLVDGERVLPESTVVVEYLDRFGDAPPMIPADPDAALRVRVWDRVLDGHVMTPMQTIVFNALRPDEHKDPFGVDGARATLAGCCTSSAAGTTTSSTASGSSSPTTSCSTTGSSPSR